MIEPKFANFFDAWWYLCGHPRFQEEAWPGGYTESSFNDSLWIDVIKVNPLTENVEEDEELNVSTCVCLECLHKEWDPEANLYVSAHDYELDCSADTFENAIIELANRHYNKYDVNK